MGEWSILARRAKIQLAELMGFGFGAGFWVFGFGVFQSFVLFSGFGCLVLVSAFGLLGGSRRGEAFRRPKCTAGDFQASPFKTPNPQKPQNRARLGSFGPANLVRFPEVSRRA